MEQNLNEAKVVLEYDEINSKVVENKAKLKHESAKGTFICSVALVVISVPLLAYVFLKRDKG